MFKEIRVRFAPSPTGVLHIGGARTALYNWLFARHHGGKFILRMEDTDRNRSTEEAIGAIVSSLKWLGLDWDEGPEVGGAYGPYRQTERLSFYKEALKKLLEAKMAYRCYCSPEELEERRKAALRDGRSPGYDGRCKKFTEKEQKDYEKEGRKYAIRFACPKEGETVVSDIIRGDVVFQNSVLEDFILTRANGLPTYNFAAVVDDATMKITHIIRGIDHLSNTPKQILLYEALSLPLPVFAHLPMILGSDGKPLSKRHGATSVEEYKKNGYLSEAILNYLALLGWSYDEKTTMFSIEDLIEKFSLEKVSKNSAIFDNAKLQWMNGCYIRKLSVDKLTDLLIPIWVDAGFFAKSSDFGIERLKMIATLVQERIKCLTEVLELTDFFFKEEIEVAPKAADKVLKNPEALKVLEIAYEKLKTLGKFDVESVEAALRSIPAGLDIKPKFVFQPIRVAVTGKTVSPPLFETIEVLGKERTLTRLTAAIGIVK
ncbi:glutamate--tRNA ligase [Candidatus Oleimmundimicrobium sp.]|uniref:glutamate--tRNA ligase n=1 Tax=Candidatus Oleimmundimicrobium sp. TaxID=3060597 RepID=UPI002720EFD6|nr:glutamate--tRNA ligase [Candidatus Oleimmundimicrobium sp.]MDO8885895.1 glutamate--tRNA ligase [Candidatus Oleimmundimicrobium sp.]